MNGDEELIRRLEPMIRGQVEELRREREERERHQLAHLQLESVLNHLPLGILIAEAPGGRLVTYNRALEEIFGFPPPLPDAIAEYSRAYPAYRPDGRRYASEEWPLARAVTTGESVTDEEILFIRPDGTRIIARVGAAPVRDGEGEITAGILTLADITGKRLEDERRELLGEVSEVLNESLDYRETVQRLAALCADAMADYAIVHVVEGEVPRAVGIAHREPEQTDATREILRGFPMEPGSGHPVMEVMRSGEALLLAKVPDALVERAVQTEQQRVLARQMDVRSAMVVPIRSAGRTLGAITLARSGGADPYGDEDLRLAEEIANRAAHAVDNARLYREAQLSAQARDEILSVVSHDLRNSLNAALMNTDLLLEVAPVFAGGTREQRQMEAVRRSLDHMHRLVQDLLEVDRIERGRLSIRPARLVPAVLGEEVPELFGSIARSAGVELRVEIGPEVPTVLADHARVVQVLGNLVGNAIRFSEEGGAVTIGAEEAGAMVRFTVTDAGAGIPEAALPRVFDRFFQGAFPDGKEARGSGLGLTITRGIVEAHGGRIGVRSREGEGSCFWFTLPRAPAGGGDA